MLYNNNRLAVMNIPCVALENLYKKAYCIHYAMLLCLS